MSDLLPPYWTFHSREMRLINASKMSKSAAMKVIVGRHDRVARAAYVSHLAKKLRASYLEVGAISHFFSKSNFRQSSCMAGSDYC